jgi:hypothetical protein
VLHKGRGGHQNRILGVLALVAPLDGLQQERNAFREDGLVDGQGGEAADALGGGTEGRVVLLVLDSEWHEVGQVAADLNKEVSRVKKFRNFRNFRNFFMGDGTFL